jgi:arylsulfatase A-like enzyme
VKAIVVMFDSLNRHMLPPYGGDWIKARNFSRLARRSATFDNCYIGSMPCIPARRELHTGRYNFLHRSWGPLEPFDDSMPEILGANGIYTHLASDHQHYWEDGGATYHTRYKSWEFFRGQEGDPWKGEVNASPVPPAVAGRRHHSPPLLRQDWINRRYLATEDRHPQTLTFDAGEAFIRANAGADSWLLQIESFDPHEPFFASQRFRDLYPHDYHGAHFDWPAYGPATGETAAEIAHIRAEYAALVSMCDHSLGRVLDLMDELDLWKDTLLIVCTDHGYMLAEHGWWGKIFQPWFNETARTPLFIWDPRSGSAGVRRTSLVQMIDFAPTILDFFGLKPTPDMQGRSLRDTVARDAPVREAALFGSFGGQVNVTDGRYVYMRVGPDSRNDPLYEYTLMPTHMRARFSADELKNLELADPFSFTKGVRPLRIAGKALGGSHKFGTILFDLDTDPQQQRPLVDETAEIRMMNLLLDLMRDNDAPHEQYDRLGLPMTGRAGHAHLLAGAQYELARSASLAVTKEHARSE